MCYLISASSFCSYCSYSLQYLQVISSILSWFAAVDPTDALMIFCVLCSSASSDLRSILDWNTAENIAFKKPKITDDSYLRIFSFFSSKGICPLNLAARSCVNQNKNNSFSISKMNFKANRNIKKQYVVVVGVVLVVNMINN